MPRPSQPARLLIAIALVLAVAMLAMTLLSAADSALSVWQRLERMPAWMRVGFLAALVAMGTAAGWIVRRLLHPRPVRMPRPQPIDRATLDARIERLDADGSAARAARNELDELQRRRAQEIVQVALFGDISSGKSSLLRALAHDAQPAIGVVGGSTREIARHRGTLPDGRTLEIADVPGTQEAGDTAHAELARAEAARSHAIVFVADGDLTRAQDHEFQALAGYGRPLLLVLNKRDRYRDDELAQLSQRLRSRYATLGVQVLSASAAHDEEVWREHADGRRERVTRSRAAQIDDLQHALQRVVRIGADVLEPGREAALHARIDRQLAGAEIAERAQRSDAAVAKYTRRAIVGALAAIAPGTDLIIQGALATALVRELCTIHALPVRDIDIDAFLARAGGLVRTTTSITLAIAGNALKAFPGLGTLGGGLLHAVAYGMIFDSLGRAVAQTLAQTAQLDRDATVAAFRAQLEQPASERWKAIAGLALDAARELRTSSPNDARVSDRSHFPEQS